MGLRGGGGMGTTIVVSALAVSLVPFHASRAFADVWDRSGPTAIGFEPTTEFSFDTDMEPRPK